MKEVKAWQVGTLLLPTIQAAQEVELAVLFESMDDGATDHEKANLCAQRVIDHADDVMAILTCQPKSKAPRKPRSDIGKPRKPKVTGPELEAK